MRFLIIAFAVFISACATPPATKTEDNNGVPMRVKLADRALHFSTYRADVKLRAWEPLIIRADKNLVNYRLVNDAQLKATVIEAQSDNAASGLKHTLSIDSADYPIVRWAWKITALNDQADAAERSQDDSPARIMLAFDGDKSKLPFSERAKLDLAEMLSGQSVPYATLIYIWDNSRPIGTVIAHPLSERIKTVVVASGPNGVNEWRRFQRNYREDFAKAFGESAGKVNNIGLMTDTDNTHGKSLSYYGDIDFIEAK